MIRNFHFVGEEKNSAADGTSLAVRQWVELVRGERQPRRPANPFRVEEVRAERRYCAGCFGIRVFDVILAVSTQAPMPGWDRGIDVPFRIVRCRCCDRVRVK